MQNLQVCAGLSHKPFQTGHSFGELVRFTSYDLNILPGAAGINMLPYMLFLALKVTVDVDLHFMNL